MRKLLIAAALALLPGPAFASTCMSLDAGGAPPAPILVMDMAAVGGFFTITGEFVGVPGGCGDFPAHGGGHLRGDGKLHFAVMVPEMSLANPGCVPFWIVATVDPPNYNSGSGRYATVTGGGATLTITPVACPPLPN